MSLVEKIKELCKKKNMSITALEKQLGFGKAAIWKWDNHPPSIDKLQAVADYFHVSTDYLLSRTHNPLPPEVAENGALFLKDTFERVLGGKKIKFVSEDGSPGGVTINADGTFKILIDTNDLTEEDIQKIHEYINLLRIKNKAK